MRFFDAHCDTVARPLAAPLDFVAPVPRIRVDLPRALQAGACAQVFAIFARQSHRPGWDLRDYVERAIAIIRGWAAHSEERMRVALTARDIRAAAAGESYYGLIGLEGADPLGEQADNLTHFFDQGLRLIIPAWGDNAFSGTSTGGQGPLTAEGARLIELAEALHCMIDVSHLSDAAFAQVCALARRPFIASHSACRALCPNPRNLTDEMIRAVAGRGGAVGIPVGPWFLDREFWTRGKYLEQSAATEIAGTVADPVLAELRNDQLGRILTADLPRPGLESIVRHVLHAIQVGGEDAVGLGGDLDGMENLVAGIEGIESYPALAEALRRGGLTEVQTEKVCWRNMARVFAEVLPE